MTGSALTRRGARPVALALPVELVPGPHATLAQAVAPFLAWFAGVRGRRELTIENYARDLRSFLAFCERRGLVYADDVTHRDIELYLAVIRQERRVKPVTASRHLSCLKAFWTYLVREQVATRNPAAVSFGPKVPPRRAPKYLTKDETERVLSTLATDTTLRGRRDYALVATLLLAGLRCSEAATLRVEEVHLDGGRLYVAHGKGDKDRFVTVIPRLVEILGTYLRDVRPTLVKRPIGRGLLATAPPPPASPWVFVTTHARGGPRASSIGKALTTRSLWNIVHDRVSPIVGRNVWTHLLRHSFASRLRAHGAPLELIGEELGHSRLDTTMIYAHVPSERRQADVARFLA